jgi:hypothetical protein
VSDKGPNKRIDAALDKLLKQCDEKLTVEQESGIKVRVEVLKAAMTWEKLKHGIRDKESEGTEWGAPSE